MQASMRTPGSIAVTIVIALMFVTPVLAATTLHPVAIRWSVLIEFVGAHRFGLIFGFFLMIVIALMLKAATARAGHQSAHIRPMVPDVRARGIDGLA